MFAFSTSWNASEHSRARDIISEIKDLGFDRIELSFNLSSTLVEELTALKKEGLFKVVSVHNFCPIPCGIPRRMASPDMFSLSAPDENRRRTAVRYTKETIDTAGRLGAEAVVLHLGNIQVREKIKELAAAHELADKHRYMRLKEQMIKERAKRAQRYLSRTLKSLEQLSDYAQKQNMKLGLENRYYFYEIPSFEEMAIILEKFPGHPVYYWHDVGHAQVYENLGLNQHKNFLEKFSPRMLGVHLHDINGIDDHRAPLKGKFDFTLLKPYIKKDTLKVLEPHYPATAEEIIQGKEYLEKLFN